MVWYSHLLQNFPQFVVIYTVEDFHIVNETEVDVFLELPCFFHDPMDVGNLSLVLLPFLNPAWKFSVHILLKPILKDFEHYLSNIWNECNCVVLWTFFGIDFLWDWNVNWPFPVLWPLLSFSIAKEAELDFFLELPCFLYDPTKVKNLISGSSAS